MNLKERVQELCKKEKISMNQLEDELGFGKGYISKLGKSTPNTTKIQKIANRFNVTVDYLMTGTTGNGICSPCPDCGMWYDPDELDDVKQHERRHAAWKEATKKFGKLYCSYADREGIKAQNRNLSHNTTLPLNERVNAQLEVLRCLFSRSVEGSGYDLRHVPFDTYVSMMLGNETYTKNNLEDELYQALLDKYGAEPGISSGSYYHIPETKTYVPTITNKDERDIAKDLKNIMDKLSSKEYGPAAYDGEDLDPEAAELFKDELEIALRRLKLINKEKSTPKKYKK